MDTISHGVTESGNDANRKDPKSKAAGAHLAETDSDSGEEDPDDYCEWCERTAADVEAEKKSNKLLPYGECHDCGHPEYLIPDADYTDYDHGGDWHYGTKLADDCFEEFWDDAAQRLLIYPKEAAVEIDALFWACKHGAPLSLIESLAALVPSELINEDCYCDYEGNLGRPMEALFSKTKKPPTREHIKILLKRNVDSAELSVGAAWSVVRDAVEGALKDLESNSQDVPSRPFAFLKNLEIEPEEKDRAKQEDCGTTSEEKSSKSKEDAKIAGELDGLLPENRAELCWANYCYLKKVSYYKTMDCETLPLLPALADCRYDYRTKPYSWETSPDHPFLLAIKLFPEELNFIDGDGNTLLHMACNVKPVREKEEWEYYDEEENEDGDDYDYGIFDDFERWTTKDEYDDYNAGKIKALLSIFPRASRVKNNRGELPFHVAVKSRKDLTILYNIWKTNENAIRAVDAEGNSGLHLSVLMTQKTDVQHRYGTDCTSDGWDVNEEIDSRWIKHAAKKAPRRLWRLPNNLGQLPLHLALTSKKQWKTGVKTVFEKFGGAVKVADKEGCFPLHLACEHADSQAIQNIFDANRAASKSPDKLGRFPLHFLVKRPEVENHAFKMILDSHPGASKLTDSEGSLPLQLFVQNRTNCYNSRRLELLLQANSEATGAVDSSGKLVLHHAAAQGWNDIHVILAAYPEAARMRDNNGRLALHEAATSYSEKIVKLLLEAYPEAAQSQDSSGRLPLHDAANTACLSTILQAYPEASGVADNSGQLPLHALAQKQNSHFFRFATAETIKLLLKANPKAAGVVDGEENLPIHCLLKAKQGACPWGKLEPLLVANPEALCTPGENGMLPFMLVTRPPGNFCASAENDSLDLTFRLLSAAPEALALARGVCKNGKRKGADAGDSKPSPATKKRKVEE